MFTVQPPPSGGQSLASIASLSPGFEASEGPGEGEALVGTPHQLAIRTDGVVLLSVEELGDADLAGRRVWSAVELTVEEASYVHQRGVNAAHEAAAKLVGAFPKKKEGGSS